MMTGDPAQTTIEGHEALRAYIEGALRRTREVRYTLNATYVDSDGKVVEWRCHY